MEGIQWIGEHWFDLLQTVGIIGGLLFTAYTTHKDDRSRQIANLIAIKEQYREIWKEIYYRPKLARVFEVNADLEKEPISPEEGLFARLLILHLGTVYRAMKAGMFVELEGLGKDIQECFAAPIPRAVWKEIEPLQDKDFVRFIENSLPNCDSVMPRLHSASAVSRLYHSCRGSSFKDNWRQWFAERKKAFVGRK